MKVVAYDGSTWRVRRRWLPWRRRVRDLPDAPVDLGGLGDDPISMILMALGLILLLPALIALIILLGEVLLLLALLPLFVLGRGLFGVPWTIELRRERRLHSTERIRGWGNTSRRMDQIATALRLGEPLRERDRAA